MKKRLGTSDYWFLIVLIIGSLIRLYHLKTLPDALDTPTYIRGAVGIIEVFYYSVRPPGFPLLIVLFILLTNLIFPTNNNIVSTYSNYILSAKLASFTSGILLIICSYIIFTKASLKYFGENKKNREKSKYTGLIVSFLISFSLPFIIDSALGLRENLLALLIIIIFYFTIIKEKMKLQDNIFLALSISYLTLTLLTAGLFSTIIIVFFFVISKLKIFKFKFETISIKKVMIIVLAFILSFFFWLLFSDYRFGNPFYNWKVQNTFYLNLYSSLFSSISSFIQVLLNGILLGIPLEFYFLFVLIGLVFTILSIYILIKNIKKKQFLFIFVFIGVNFAYLSIFVSIIGFDLDYRVILYFFPIIFYLGAIELGNIIVELNRKHKDLKTFMSFLLIIFLITYLIQRYIKAVSLNPIIYWIFFFINEISLLLLLLCYFLQNKNKNKID